MDALAIAAAAAWGLTVVFFVASAAPGAKPWRHGWLIPAALCALFVVWTLVAVVEEGVFGFWPRGAWTLQIWFDLVFAISIGWALIVPDARRLGMKPMAWLPFVAATISIGLLAMMARREYLRARADAH